MSVDLLRLVPVDPELVPDCDSAKAARTAFERLVSEAVEVTFDLQPEIVFWDPGENLVRIRCPGCGKEIERSWWQGAMEESFGTGFRNRAVVLPCCGAESDLDALDYDGPAGFARFALVAREPARGPLALEELAAVEGPLGSRLRQVRARY